MKWENGALVGDDGITWNFFVDGGLRYLRRGGDFGSFTDTSIIEGEDIVG